MTLSVTICYACGHLATPGHPVELIRGLVALCPPCADALQPACTPICTTWRAHPTQQGAWVCLGCLRLVTVIIGEAKFSS